MALFSNRIDDKGTHIISGGHSSSDTSGKRSYPFERPPKSINMHVYVEGQGKNSLATGSNQVYDLNGSFDMTVLNTIAVYLNGMILHESEYQIDTENKTIKIIRWISPADDDIEVRSQEDDNFSNINGVLILEVTPGVIETEDLIHYTPSYGDVLNVNRLAQIEHNQKNSVFVNETRGKNVTAYVLSHQIQKNGIVARIKVKEVRDDNE